jgi:GNAT superfamily N-acetyltransferase
VNWQSVERADSGHALQEAERTGCNTWAQNIPRQVQLRIVHIADEKSAREYWVTTDRVCDCNKARVRRTAAVVGQDISAVFRYYQPSDYGQVAALWSRINRELAPAGMEELFEQYIATMISGELARLSEVFSETKKNAFWVVDRQGEIVGCFGIESHSGTETELRRMYLDREFRGAGVAKRMLECAEELARSLGFRKMLVSTAEIQRAADRFYRRSGFRQLRVEVAQAMTAKQAGGGLTRFYFEKEL